MFMSWKDTEIGLGFYSLIVCTIAVTLTCHFRMIVLVVAAILIIGKVLEAQALQPGCQWSNSEFSPQFIHLIYLGLSFLHYEEEIIIPQFS